MAVTTTIEELHAKYGPKILSKRLELLNKTEVSLRDFSFIIETDDYDMLIINGIDPKLHGLTLYPQKIMANTLGGATTFGSKCSRVLHHEAVKGYLECRRLLVERETAIVMKMMEWDAIQPVLTGEPPKQMRWFSHAAKFVECPVGEKTFAQVELETVRAEIAEIDRLIGGGNRESSAIGPLTTMTVISLDTWRDYPANTISLINNLLRGHDVRLDMKQDTENSFKLSAISKEKQS